MAWDASCSRCFAPTRPAPSRARWPTRRRIRVHRRRTIATAFTIISRSTCAEQDVAMNVLEVMRVGPVIPVIVIDELAHAVPLARALVAGGVRVLEVTLRTRVALDAILAIAREVDDAIVGGGTISRAEHFQQAV